MSRELHRGTALAVLAVLAVAGCTSGTTGDPASRPTSTSGTAPRALIASAVQVDPGGFQTGSDDPSVPAAPMPGVVQFMTPSHNIRCTLIGGSSSPASLLCEPSSFTFAIPPMPTTCQNNWAAIFGLDDSGVHLGMCVGGEEVTFASRVLPYGDAIQTQGIGCYSSSAALTCLDLATGHGFTVNRARFVQF